jgi:hypothetical protein
MPAAFCLLRLPKVSQAAAERGSLPVWRYALRKGPSCRALAGIRQQATSKYNLWRRLLDHPLSSGSPKDGEATIFTIIARAVAHDHASDFRHASNRSTARTAEFARTALLCPTRCGGLDGVALAAKLSAK